MRSAGTKTEIVSAKAYPVVEAGKPRKIVLEINNDVLTFREQGKRQRFTLPVDAAFREAIIHTQA